MKKIMILAYLLTVLTGCQQYKDEGITVLPVKETIFKEIGKVSANERTLTVHHKVKSNNVYIECLVPNFSFKDPKDRKLKDGEGYIKVSVNGTHVTDIYKAAFIVRGLPVGKHEIKLEIVHNEDTSYGLSKTFTAEITEKP
ncbi:hypothetical protein [Bacillus taeanensis]|uniref:Lipoprotein n=1 Tax=Bacillus taeanensis TaxID=273032 RepID=A0A366Y1E6_9BACI|nr:hypothetical protein [Bacillus taeanensis]RBW70234.1 hypothetical protein DS031_06585 [Bacillus taeanensis]